MRKPDLVISWGGSYEPPEPPLVTGLTQATPESLMLTMLSQTVGHHFAKLVHATNF